MSRTPVDVAPRQAAATTHVLENEARGPFGAGHVVGLPQGQPGARVRGDHQTVPRGEDLVIQPRLHAFLTGVVETGPHIRQARHQVITGHLETSYNGSKVAGRTVYR